MVEKSIKPVPTVALQVFVNGMFSFVLYDSGRDEYFVARDPVSISVVGFAINISISTSTNKKYE